MIKNENNEILIPTNEKFEPFSVVQDGTTYYTPRMAERMGTAIECMDTYNDALNPTIKGKSEQTVTVQGKNLLDNRHTSWYNQDAIIQDGWYVAKDGYFSGVVLGFFQVYSGRRYALTFTYKSDNIGHFMISSATSTAGLFDTNISLDLVADSTERRGEVVFTATQDVLARVWLLKTGNASIKGTSMYKDINLIEEQTDSPEVPPYEPFIPNSPSPAYPSPIRSSENFNIVSCGRNLFDYTQSILSWYSVLGEYKGRQATISITDKYGAFALWSLSKLEVGKTYTFSIDVCASVPLDWLNNQVYAGIGSVGRHTSVGITTEWQTISVAITIAGDMHILHLYTKFIPGAIFYTSNFQIEEGATANPYQPYHGTTANITDPLRSVGDVSDSIEVSEGKVEVVRRIERCAVTSSSDISEHDYGYQKGYTHFKVRTTLYLNRNPSLCNVLPYYWRSWVFPVVGIDVSGYLIFPNFENLTLGISDADTPTQKVSKLKSWLETHEMYVDVLPEKPTRTDITATPLGQALLALRTVPHYTQVYTNAEIQPMLQASINVVMDDVDAKII